MKTLLDSLWATVVALALLAALVAAVPAADPKPPVKVTVSEATYADLDKAVTDKTGQVVFVDFWATWCPPCVKKFPSVADLHKTYGDKGLVVVSVSLDKYKRGYKIDTTAKFLADHGATFPNFVIANPAGDAKEIGKRFGLGGTIPYQTLFNKKGERVWDGDAKPLSDKELAALIEAELAK